MKRFLIGGMVAASVGVGMYLLAVENDMPAPTVKPTIVAAAPPAPPAPPPPPAVLAEVIDVTDIDSLLDPPAKPLTGVPFDVEPVVTPQSVPDAPERIPPAVD